MKVGDLVRVRKDYWPWSDDLPIGVITAVRKSDVKVDWEDPTVAAVERNRDFMLKEHFEVLKPPEMKDSCLFTLEEIHGFGPDQSLEEALG